MPASVGLRFTLLFAAVLVTISAPPIVYAQNTPAFEQVVPITLRSWGFEHKEIVVRAKKSQISFHDRSGLNTASITMERVNNGQAPSLLFTGQFTKVGKRVAREVIPLTPGSYVISLKEYPNVTCKLTVQP